MGKSGFTPVLLLSAGAVLTVISVPNLAAELAPYLANGTVGGQLSAAIASGSYRPAASQRARELYMWDCYAAVDAYLRAPGGAVALPRSCQLEAARIAAETPTDSLSWLVVAQASYALGEFDEMNDALHHSWAAAPRIDHLADRRSYVAERQFQRLDQRSREIYEADIALIAASRDALPFLAYRYVHNPLHRGTYRTAVEQASPSQQRRFLGLVKRLTTGGRS